MYEGGNQEKSERITPLNQLKVQGQITGFTLQNTIFIEVIVSLINLKPIRSCLKRYLNRKKRQFYGMSSY